MSKQLSGIVEAIRLSSLLNMIRHQVVLNIALLNAKCQICFLQYDPAGAFVFELVCEDICISLS